MKSETEKKVHVSWVVLAAMAAFGLGLTAASAKKLEGTDRSSVFIDCMSEYSFRATCTRDCGWVPWSWAQVEQRCAGLSGIELPPAPESAPECVHVEQAMKDCVTDRDECLEDVERLVE